MAKAYYTDAMRDAFRECPNTLNFPLELTQMEDQAGPYLCIKFNASDYRKYGEDREMLTIVAEDLVYMKNVLTAAGARVTFVVVDDGGDND